MKTIQELYKEVSENEILKSECLDAIDEGKLAEFLQKHDCPATEEEVNRLLKVGSEYGEIEDDELDYIAGGGKCGTTYYEGRPVVSPLSTCGNWKPIEGEHFGVAGYAEICSTCSYYGKRDGFMTCFCPDRGVK